MAVRYTLVIDCADPERMTRFWADALGYVPEPPPEGHPTWAAYWREFGLPEELAGLGEVPDSLVDPEGGGPRIWFQVVPEGKTLKNRLHLDVNVGGGLAVPLETRRERVEAEAARLVAAGATRVSTLYEEGLAFYAVAMLDPEGNEFDIN